MCAFIVIMQRSYLSSLINKHSSKDVAMVQLLRCLFFYAAFYQFHYSSTHIAGKSNTVVDMLSRIHVSNPSFLVPQVPEWPIPVTILNLLLLQTPDWISSHWTDLFIHSLSKDSRPTHRSGIRQFIAFCAQFSIAPLPVTQMTLCRFVAWLHARGLALSSMRQYLSAIRFYQISSGGPNPSLPEMPVTLPFSSHTNIATSSYSPFTPPNHSKESPITIQSMVNTTSVL